VLANEIQFEPGSAAAHAGFDEIFTVGPALAIPSATELLVVLAAELATCCESARAVINDPAAITASATVAICFSIIQFLRGIRPDFCRVFRFHYNLVARSSRAMTFFGTRSFRPARIYTAPAVPISTSLIPRHIPVLPHGPYPAEFPSMSLSGNLHARRTFATVPI
jgi:hypothetical protein